MIDRGEIMAKAVVWMQGEYLSCALEEVQGEGSPLLCTSTIHEHHEGATSGLGLRASGAETSGVC